MRNPPVTASPCQPPLGKGAKGTGDADCHTSDIGHWFATTRFFARSAVQGRLGRTEASAPAEGNKKPCGAGRRGRRPLRMGRGVRIATASVRTGFAMTRFLQGVQWAGDRKGRPYGSVARSAVGRETARVAPTERRELIILIFRKERCVWS